MTLCFCFKMFELLRKIQELCNAQLVHFGRLSMIVWTHRKLYIFLVTTFKFCHIIQNLTSFQKMLYLKIRCYPYLLWRGRLRYRKTLYSLIPFIRGITWLFPPTPWFYPFLGAPFLKGAKKMGSKGQKKSFMFIKTFEIYIYSLIPLVWGITWPFMSTSWFYPFSVPPF